MISLAPRSGNTFSGSPLSRVAELRRDIDWVSDRLSDTQSLFVVYWQGKHLIDISGDPKAVFLSQKSISVFFDGNEEIVFLGLGETNHSNQGRAYFGVDLSHIDESTLLDFIPGSVFMEIRETVEVIKKTEASILACTRGLLYWHRQSCFCGYCGTSTKSIGAGHERVCSNNKCNKKQFPRIDPAIIVLVQDNDRCLLGRQPWWPKGMHSTLAGFVEPGESLEEAVKREVMEESGIIVGDIIYHSSQPWPLPSSLMIGFIATAYSTKIIIDEDELESARWISRKEIQSTVENDKFRLPGDYSIARRLIDDWLSQF